MAAQRILAFNAHDVLISIRGKSYSSAKKMVQGSQLPMKTALQVQPISIY